MANVDPPRHQHQQQQRRWSVGRSSTPRSHFSRHSSEAFYSTEPLSGSGRRALHNGNGGPDPDSPYSAPDSCDAPPEARSVRQQYRASARPGSEELFYTLPRNLAVSRKEILRRRSVKDEAEQLRPAEGDQARRPTTLPSIGRRARLQEADTVERASSLLKRVSRQDILRRRASVESSPRNVARTSFPDLQGSSSRSAKEDLSRPSTLPKTLHASRTPRLEDCGSSRTKEAAGREAPIYGRIRRRKMSLPTGATTLRDPAASSSTTLTRFSRTRTSGERAEPTTRVVRHLRDPVPDPLDRPRCAADAAADEIYAKVARKVARQASQSREERQPESSIDRAMSRRRIISKASQMDSLERRMHLDRDQDVVRIRHDAILVSRADIERLRNFKAGKGDLEKSCRQVDSTDWSTRRDARADSWSSRKCLRKDSTWGNERQARCKSKSQSGLPMEGRETESAKATRPTTLPSYVKLGRKTSTGSAARNADLEQKRSSSSGMLTKQSKERSNYVRKTATRIPVHVRTFSDANNTRSNSPETSSSIFGFCTGKRKVQAQASSMTRSFPSWNLKTV